MVGGQKGSWDAGVFATLCRYLGPDLFDGMNLVSVDSHAGTFYVAEQPDTIENTWKNGVHGSKLIDYRNISPFRDEPILKLEYLTESHRNGASKLDVERVLTSQTEMVYVVTNWDTLEPMYLSPETEEEVFRLMEASCAHLPFHGCVEVNGVRGADGAFSDPWPVQKALDDGYDEVLVVTNKHEGYDPRNSKWFLNLFRKLPSFETSRRLDRILENYERSYYEMKRLVEEDPRVDILRPSEPLGMPLWERDRNSLVEAFEKGVRDAENYIERSDLVDTVRRDFRRTG